MLESLKKEDEADGSEWLWSSVYGYNKPWVVVYPPATMVELSFTGEIFVRLGSSAIELLLITVVCCSYSYYNYYLYFFNYCYYYFFFLLFKISYPLGYVCFLENTFREIIFQIFLYLFIIKKVGQRKTLSGQRKTLSSQRKTLSS